MSIVRKCGACGVELPEVTLEEEAEIIAEAIERGLFTGSNSEDDEPVAICDDCDKLMMAWWKTQPDYPGP